MPLELKIKNRTVLGKKVKTLRREGWLPAEIYGHGTPNRHVSVDAKEFEKTYSTAGAHTVITLVSENGEITPAMIAGADRDAVRNVFRSADLHAVRMDEKIHVHVPIRFVGESPAVKAGLLLVKVMDELEVSGLPANIPHAIEIDLSVLAAGGDSINVGDLVLPKNVQTPVEPETVVASITEKRTEEPVAAPAATEEVAVAAEQPAETGN